jgi:hypothetical protein
MTAARKLEELEMSRDEEMIDPDLANSDSEATRLIKLALSKLEEGMGSSRETRRKARALRSVCTPTPGKF